MRRMIAGNTRAQTERAVPTVAVVFTLERVLGGYARQRVHRTSYGLSGREHRP
jgi:hypothetical protein